MSAEIATPSLTRQMIGRPALVAKPDQAIVIRVRELQSARWTVERYAGSGDKWYPLLFTSSRERAWEDAQLRRSRDLVIINCCHCGADVGDDVYMTCEGCGEAAFDLPCVEHGWSPSTLPLNAYTVGVALVAALLLITCCVVGAK